MGPIHVVDGAKPHSKNLFWWWHLDSSSVRRLSVNFLLAVIIRSFAARHSWHFLVQLVYGVALPRISCDGTGLAFLLQAPDVF